MNLISEHQVYFSNASRSTTSLRNLINIVQRCGVPSSPVECAVTRSVKNIDWSKIASIIPAKNALQFNCDILGGTEINFVNIGALSWTISAVNHELQGKYIHHHVPLTFLVSRLVFQITFSILRYVWIAGCLEFGSRVANSFLAILLIPMPFVLRDSPFHSTYIVSEQIVSMYRRSSSAIPSTLFCAYDTISAKRNVYAEWESSSPRERFRLRSYIEGLREMEERME